MGRGDVMTYLASTFSTMSNIPGNCPSELLNRSKGLYLYSVYKVAYPTEIPL